ncbi:MAG: AmmeMemoRadiSam system protein B [Candidatus Peregrinibacteria bacterium]
MKKFFLFILIPACTIFTLFWWKISERIAVNTYPEASQTLSVTPEDPSEYLRSYFSTPKFYEDAYESAKTLTSTHPEQAPDKTVKNVSQIFIVNHHLLAPHFIAQVMDIAGSPEIKTVFLLSPNHHHRGGKTILMSALPWKTPFGFLFTNSETLEKSGFPQMPKDMMQAEHGISGLVAFVKKSFPSAQIVPFAVDDSATTEDIRKLESFLSQNLTPDAVVIESTDFSHDLTSDIADFHDQMSLSVLKSLDTEGAKRVDIDSRPILQTLILLAKEKGYTSFEMLQNSNSSKILKNPDQEMPTSYITGYFFSPGSGKKGGQKEKITILATGDIMMDRYIRKTIEKKGIEHIIDPFFQRFLSGQDITLVNHEGAMTPKAPHPPKGDMTNFTVNPSLSKNLFDDGINIASLANNHTLDFGKSGYTESKNYLESAGISTFGHPFNTQNISVIKEIRGVKIGFVAYHELFTHDPQTVLDEIKRIRPAVDFIIVYAHWGTEYFTGIPPSQQKTAKQLVDAGADMIIGHHPHVVQPMEIYNGKPIFYSLGNFIFDQIFSEEVRTGLTLGMVIEKDTVEISFFPMYRNANFSARIMNGDERRKFLQNYAEKSAVGKTEKEEIKSGKIVIPRKTL